MDLHSTLRIVTYVGLSISFLAALTSQLWRSSVEVEGTIRKRLTPAGWVSLGISAVGLLTGVASEVIRSRVEYAASQSTQQRTNELIASTQPLTSLSLHWQFSSSDPLLWKVMRDGENAIRENAESSQGGVPRIPFEIVDYDAALVPLLSFIARIGPKSYDDWLEHGLTKPIDSASIVVLIPLDDSLNAILSLGQIDRKVDWYLSGQANALSAGFATSSLRKKPRQGSSIPHVSTKLAPTASGASSYTINWALDPTTLANSIDRMNAAVPSTAKLPRVLKIAVFYDMQILPFKEGDFANTAAENLWTSSGQKDVVFNDTVRDVELVLSSNGSPEPAYKYTLKKIYRKELLNQNEDEIRTRCTLLEFHAS